MTRTPRKTVKITGLVRHYHTPKSDHHPYRGIIKTDDDEDYYLEKHGKKSVYTLTLQNLLAQFQDGEAITITVEGFGTHPNAKGFIWMLTKPHTYERIAETKDDGNNRSGES